jgi:hypothetical protein
MDIQQMVERLLADQEETKTDKKEIIANQVKADVRNVQNPSRRNWN